MISTLLFGIKTAAKTVDITNTVIQHALRLLPLAYKHKKKTGLLLLLLISYRIYMVFPDYVRKYQPLRQIVSTLLDYLSHQPKLPVHACRSAFRETQQPMIAPTTSQHSHPKSAAARSSCLPFAMSYAMALGLEPFLVQASPTDLKAGVDYNRSYYWGKDLLVPSSNSQPSDNHIPVIVDVDYYMDMAVFLLGRTTPVVLYTFQPQDVCNSHSEYSYTFNSKNEVRYTVKGGAEYVHMVWNYHKDVIIVRSHNAATIFQIERKLADVDHEYIALIPIANYYGYFSTWLTHSLEYISLTRLKPCQGDFLVLDVQGDTGLTVSVARVDRYASAKIPRHLYDAVFSSSLCTAISPGVATIQSWVEDHGGREAAAVVCDFLKHGTAHDITRIYPADPGVLRYQLLRRPSEYDPDAKPLMTGFMLPLIPAGYVPDNCASNDLAAVLTRVAVPQEEAKVLAGKFTPKWLTVKMMEFIRLLVPTQGLGQPYEISTVYEKQSRPAQRQLLERASGMLAPEKARASTFLKAEPYQKAGDPRIISTFNTVDKREYSRFIYALADLVSLQSWYSFGKTPQQIADEVAKICVSADEILCADASKMDGHIHCVVRELELALLLRWAHPKHHETLRALHARQYHLSATTTHSIKYWVEFQRGSGSPETALFNTILSKFIDFLYRSRFMTTTEAFEAPGQFGGDDSIVPMIGDKQALVKSAAAMGQKYEVDCYKRGSYGVNYLSRYYTTDVWYGDVSSTCDLKRQLSKLHLSGNDPNVPKIDRLVRKLCGLARTDNNTPIIRSILQRARELNIELYDTTNSDSWWAHYEEEVNWPNARPRDELFILDYFIPGHDIRSFEQYISTCDIIGLLSMPSLIGRGATLTNPSFTTVVGKDEMIIQKQPSIEATPTGTAVVIRTCNDYVRGQCARKNCKFLHLKPAVTLLDKVDDEEKGDAPNINFSFTHARTTPSL